MSELTDDLRAACSHIRELESAIIALRAEIADVMAENNELEGKLSDAVRATYAAMEERDALKANAAAAWDATKDQARRINVLTVALRECVTVLEGEPHVCSGTCDNADGSCAEIKAAVIAGRAALEGK